MLFVPFIRTAYHVNIALFAAIENDARCNLSKLDDPQEKMTGVSTERKRKLYLGVPIIGGMLITLLFLLSIYGYSRLFPLIEASRIVHFDRNVAEALAAGDVARALRIARQATMQSPSSFDPMSFTAYGRALLAAGRTEEALAALDQAVHLEKEMVGKSTRVTRKPFYFAPARLTLGQYYWGQGQAVAALEQFELARAYADLAAAEYEAFHPTLYTACAEQGLWASALAFGAPTDADLDGLDLEALTDIGRIAESRQDWPLMRGVVARMLARASDSAEAAYLLGRTDLAENRYVEAAAHLQEAAAGGRAQAAFLLGVALEQGGQTANALEAFLAVPTEDLYHPFALGKALALLSSAPQDPADVPDTQAQALLGRLENAVAALRAQGHATGFDHYARYRPLAVVPSATYFDAGGRFPLLVLWEDSRPGSTNSSALPVVCGDLSTPYLLLKTAECLLQLQWVENAVNWQVIERLPTGAAPVPGWIDTAHDWFELRDDYAAEIGAKNGGNQFLSIDKLTWYYSVLMQVPASKADAGYILAGRLEGPSGKASLGLQALNENEDVIFETRAIDGLRPGQWSWQAGYVPTGLLWDRLRVQINVAPRAGKIAFDDLMLVAVKEPDFGTEENHCFE